MKLQKYKTLLKKITKIALKHLSFKKTCTYKNKNKPLFNKLLVRFLQKHKYLIKNKLIPVITSWVLMALFVTLPINWQRITVLSFADIQAKNEWGVLAVNTNKSVYYPNETIKMTFGILNDKGNMICNAKITLFIKDRKSNNIMTLSTNDGHIKVNNACFLKDYTQEPDYYTEFQLVKTGNYYLEIEAETDEGNFSAIKNIKIEDKIPYEVERIAPTRIFPVKDYPVEIRIKVNEDFKGIVQDVVPYNFDLTRVEKNIKIGVSVDKKYKFVTWDVDMKKGQTVNLRYEFNAPDYSPEFYTLGLIRMEKERNPLVKEFDKFLSNTLNTKPFATTRSSEADVGATLDGSYAYQDLDYWQIASDDVLTKYGSSCSGWSNSTNAQGSPTLASTAVLADFTTSNSAYANPGSNGPNLDCTITANEFLGAITGVNVVWSYASEGSTGTSRDTVQLQYSTNGSTYTTVATITMSANYSNSTNGGYWSYAATGITAFSQLANTTLRADSAKNGGNDGTTAYIDASWVEVTYTPITFTQNDFEWYVPASSVALSNIWPAGSGEDLTENQVMTQIPASQDPLDSGEQIRIQMNFTVAGSSMPATVLPFRLQYVQASDCTTAVGWADIGAKASASIWRLFDNTTLGDSVAQVNQISTSSSGAEGYYSEIIPSGTNPNNVAIGNYTEWDWPVENNGATASTTYCFRMARSSGSAFDTYNSDSYPKLTTAPSTDELMRHGKMWVGDTPMGMFWAD